MIYNFTMCPTISRVLTTQENNGWLQTDLKIAGLKGTFQVISFRQQVFSTHSPLSDWIPCHTSIQIWIPGPFLCWIFTPCSPLQWALWPLHIFNSVFQLTNDSFRTIFCKRFVSKRLCQLEGGRILSYNHTGEFPQLLSTRSSWVFVEVIFSDDLNHLSSVFPHYVLLSTQLIHDFWGKVVPWYRICVLGWGVGCLRWCWGQLKSLWLRCWLRGQTWWTAVELVNLWMTWHTSP